MMCSYVGIKNIRNLPFFSDFCFLVTPANSSWLDAIRIKKGSTSHFAITQWRAVHGGPLFKTHWNTYYGDDKYSCHEWGDQS